MKISLEGYCFLKDIVQRGENRQEIDGWENVMLSSSEGRIRH